jgi:hypothetical protein
MLEPRDIAQYAVKFKPAGGPRFWYASEDGNAVHHTREAAKFPTPSAARSFANEIAKTKPDAVFQIIPV